MNDSSSSTIASSSLPALPYHLFLFKQDLSTTSVYEKAAISSLTHRSTIAVCLCISCNFGRLLITLMGCPLLYLLITYPNGHAHPFSREAPIHWYPPCAIVHEVDSHRQKLLGLHPYERPLLQRPLLHPRWLPRKDCCVGTDQHIFTDNDFTQSVLFNKVLMRENRCVITDD